MESFPTGVSVPVASLGEVRWRASTASGPDAERIELAELPNGDVAMRSSRDPEGPALLYTRAEIRAFVHGAKGGEFDDLTV